ncbi:GGDEF domain-containing response regulator [Silvibacterium acidisoli]|uniref:GGDEF domain-containing response regulator n=1 Tax=Acidobacteriaceae bacterium ZG23-2 TaxID=2883246 RepID=UPI00406C5340
MIPLRQPMPKILLASPGTSFGETVRLRLEKWGYPVHFVEDRDEAIALLASRNGPAIALINADMGSGSGVEVISEVRRKVQLSSPWIGLLCEQADTNTIACAMNAGADDYFVKAAGFNDLRIRLAVAERRRLLANQYDVARLPASHDHLTGLWNREAMVGMLFAETDRVQRTGTPMALLLMDIDHFSAVNLDYGHDAGDRVLRELADRFRRHLRSYDLIGRYGGDAFLIALPACTSDQAFTLAVRIKQSILGDPFASGRHPLKLTASIGFAQSHGRSPLVVLREAERALAETKLRGRDQIIEYQRDPSGAPTYGQRSES